MTRWWSLILITVFNLTDLCGRLMPSIPALQIRSESTCLSLAASRIMFLPLFVLCVKPRWIRLDALQCGVVALFGVSNGYLGSMTMMLVCCSLGVGIGRAVLVVAGARCSR